MTIKFDKTLTAKVTIEQHDIIHNIASEMDVDVSVLIREFIDSLETDEEKVRERIKYSKLVTKLNENKLKKIEKTKEQKQKEKEQEDKITQEKKAKDEEDGEFTKNKNNIWKKVVEFYEETKDKEKTIKVIKKSAKNKKQKERLIQELTKSVKLLFEE